MSTIEESIKSFWNEAAENNPYWYVSSYGKYVDKRDLEAFWASGHSIWKDIKKAIGYQPTKSDRVVEIGCGVGRLTRAIAPEVCSVVALDISEKMLGIARMAGIPNAEFFAAEGFSISCVPDKSVDLCLAYCVFQHLPSLSALSSYLNEMYRVTRLGGIVAFTLSPRKHNGLVMAALRVRAYLREKLIARAPRGTYKKEWTGIRPTERQVRSLSPLFLSRFDLDEGRILYFVKR